MRKASFNASLLNRIWLELPLAFPVGRKYPSVQPLLHFSVELLIKLELRELVGMQLKWWAHILVVVLGKTDQAKWHWKI